MTTVIYGASDDLLELDGDVREEFYVDQEEAWYIGLSNGVVLCLTNDDDATWRLAPMQGHDLVAIVPARGEDAEDDADGCPGYSDKAIVADGVAWVVAGRHFCKKSPAPKAGA